MLDPKYRGVFLVWGNERQGPRSRVLARELGLGQPVFVAAGTSRGAASAPLRYARQAIATRRYLANTRPGLVLVQSPPGFAALSVYLYALSSGTRYLVDAHNDAFEQPIWTRPQALYRALARNAVATIVTNHHEHDQIQALGGRAFILPDPPTQYPVRGRFPVQGDFSIAVVGSYSPDEPVAEILQAARETVDVQFFLTGDLKLAPAGMLENIPSNIHLTDYLDSVEYYTLLASVDAVMCLCTGEHTWQGGAGEGLWLGKPLIVSDMGILRDYFVGGTVFVANTADGIREGIVQMRAHHVRYRHEICALQEHKRVEGKARLRALQLLIDTAMAERKYA